MASAQKLVPDAVVFDFDGLILDTEWTTYQATSEVFAEFDAEFSLDVWISFVGTTDHPHWTDLLAEQVSEPLDLEGLRTRRNARSFQLAQDLDLLPGVLALMEALKAARVPIAVASASRMEWPHRNLSARGLDHYFHTILCGDDVEFSKPHPAIYELACERLGVDPAGSVALEDSVLGVESAKSAGMTAIAIPGHLTTDHDFGRADIIVGSCADLTVRDLAFMAARS